MNIHETEGNSLTVVLPETLLRRNLAEQSKWLNDETGDRSWAKHETHQIAWIMDVQRKALAKGA